MITTWIEGSFEEFIKASQAGYDKGVRFLHFLGGTTIDLKRNRAIAQTKQTISHRVTIDGVLCDVVCTGRFYFFLEKRKGRWGIVLFQPILEKDRLDPVDPSATLKLDSALLALTERDIAILPTPGARRPESSDRRAGLGRPRA